VRRGRASRPKDAGEVARGPPAATQEPPSDRLTPPDRRGDGGARRRRRASVPIPSHQEDAGDAAQEPSEPGRLALNPEDAGGALPDLATPGLIPPHSPERTGVVRRPSPHAAWVLLGSVAGLASRLRAAAKTLGPDRNIEASWLRGAADLLERGEPERMAARESAIGLEELPREARLRKAALLAAWVDAAEALRAAVHLHETERGPLVESLFPEWRGSSLRRHADQALAAESELQRRLTTSYVVRRLGERATETALRPPLEALRAAAEAWTAERDRPPLAGAEAEKVRTRLLALAEETTRTLDRVRWVVRAALAARPDLVEAVFSRRARSSEVPAPGPGGGTVQAPSPPAEESPATMPARVEARPSGGPSAHAFAVATPDAVARVKRGRRTKKHPRPERGGPPRGKSAPPGRSRPARRS
jgi:hypothetical protein